MHDLESYFDDNDEEEQIDGGLLPEIAQIKEVYYKEKFGFASIDKLSIVDRQSMYTICWFLGMF